MGTNSSPQASPAYQISLPECISRKTHHNTGDSEEVTQQHVSIQLSHRRSVTEASREDHIPNKLSVTCRRMWVRLFLISRDTLACLSASSASACSIKQCSFQAVKYTQGRKHGSKGEAQDCCAVAAAKLHYQGIIACFSLTHCLCMAGNIRMISAIIARHRTYLLLLPKCLHSSFGSTCKAWRHCFI